MRYALIAFCLWASGAWAQFEVPALTGPVVDNAQMFSPGARSQVEAYLRRLHERGGTQIQVVTVPSLGGISIEEAGIKIADQWKIGDAKQDNGVILLFAQQERKVRIEVGQGREGDLPDVIASRIIREVIVPKMRQGSPDQALASGIAAIVSYTDKEGVAGQAQPESQRTLINGNMLQLLLLMLFFMIAVLPALFGRRRRGRGIFHGGGFGGGGYSGGGFGGGGFGGGGGGWSGGGGGFSGGGASGSW